MVLDQFTTPDLVETAITAVTALVGLYIGYQAYRGLRRHDSPQCGISQSDSSFSSA